MLIPQNSLAKCEEIDIRPPWNSALSWQPDPCMRCGCRCGVVRGDRGECRVTEVDVAFVGLAYAAGYERMPVRGRSRWCFRRRLVAAKPALAMPTKVQVVGSGTASVLA